MQHFGGGVDLHDLLDNEAAGEVLEQWAVVRADIEHPREAAAADVGQPVGEVGGHLRPQVIKPPAAARGGSSIALRDF